MYAFIVKFDKGMNLKVFVYFILIYYDHYINTKYLEYQILAKTNYAVQCFVNIDNTFESDYIIITSILSIRLLEND